MLPLYMLLASALQDPFTPLPNIEDISTPISISMVVNIEGETKAVINDQIYTVGMSLAGGKILYISNEKVVIGRSGREPRVLTLFNRNEK